MPYLSSLPAWLLDKGNALDQCFAVSVESKPLWTFLLSQYRKTVSFSGIFTLLLHPFRSCFPEQFSVRGRTAPGGIDVSFQFTHLVIFCITISFSVAAI